MKITVVCDVLGKENNGTTIAAMNLIRFLHEKGHDVRVLCCDKDKETFDGYFVVPTRNFYFMNSYVEKNGVTIAKPDDEIIKKSLEGIDIVHIMLPFALGIRTAQIAKELHIPISAGCHLLAENFSIHLHMQDVKLVNDIAYKHFYKLYELADCIHYVTPYLRTLYEGKYGPTNGYVISNGVSEEFTPADNPADISDVIKIVYTGRYSREKAHHILLDAVALSKHSKKIQLILPGSGPIKEQLEKKIEKYDYPKPQMGFIDREKMPDVLRSCYLYVHAAEIEAEGIGCLEAISCGLVPIINDSPRCATHSYSIDEHTSFKDGNPQDLANKIDYWIDNPDKYIEERQKYIEMSSNLFSRKKCMEQMEQMLLKTIEKFGNK